jgi:hypothetical protein
MKSDLRLHLKYLNFLEPKLSTPIIRFTFQMLNLMDNRSLESGMKHMDRHDVTISCIPCSKSTKCT